MDSNEKKRDLEMLKATEKLHRGLMEALAQNEPDPTTKMYMLLGLQTLRIKDVLRDVAVQYADFKNKNNSYEEAKQILEYLQLVEGGMNLFLKEIGYYGKEKDR